MTYQGFGLTIAAMTGDRDAKSQYTHLLLSLAEEDDAKARVDQLTEKHLRPLLKAAIDYINEQEAGSFSRQNARITLKPEWVSVYLFERDFELLQQDLDELGHEVAIEPTGHTHGAGIDPNHVIEFAVYFWLAKEVGRIGRRVLDQITDEITAAVIKRFRDRPADRVTIYGPYNRVLTVVDLKKEREDG